MQNIGAELEERTHFRLSDESQRLSGSRLPMPASDVVKAALQGVRRGLGEA
jgi:hypothetical protein